MFQLARTRLFIFCPHCRNEESFKRVDHIPEGSTAGPWSCNKCHRYFSLKRLAHQSFEVTLEPIRETPVTVTLKSRTAPPIFLKLHTWKYAHSQNDTKEEYEAHQQYFYDEHTCPTNWTNEIVEITFQGDNDPHGVFEFVRVEDGHFKDPTLIEPLEY